MIKNKISSYMDNLFAFTIKKKIVFLCISVGIIIFLIIMGSRSMAQKTYDDEKIQLIREATLAVDACEQHTHLVVNQVDILIHAVRMAYNLNQSISETEHFINGLNYDTSIIENIFLAGSDGSFIIPSDKKLKALNIRDRDYFAYHSSVSDDNIYISSVEKGRISQQYRFRISRRFNNADGSFGGVIIITINPSSFTRYYQELKVAANGLASLLGTADKKLRARIPEPSEDKWHIPIDTPTWEALEKADHGNFESILNP